MLETLQARIAGLDRELPQWRRGSPVSLRLGAIPGADPDRDCPDGGPGEMAGSSPLPGGWSPRPFGTGGALRLGCISKHGDGYLRRNLVHGARAALSWLLRKDGSGAPPLQAAGRGQVHELGRRGSRRSQCAYCQGDGASRPALPMRRSDDGGLDPGYLCHGPSRTLAKEHDGPNWTHREPTNPVSDSGAPSPAGQIGNPFAERRQGQRSAINRSHRQAAGLSLERENLPTMALKARQWPSHGRFLIMQDVWRETAL